MSGMTSKPNNMGGVPLNMAEEVALVLFCTPTSQVL